MIDCSFIAMIGPGSATATVSGGNSSAASTNPVAVDAAQAVGQHVKAISRVLGEVMDVRVRDLQNIDLHSTESGTDERT